MLAQTHEPAQYRITYDCEAQVITGKPSTYRWMLDIGESSAVFFNENYRAYNREMAEISATGDVLALVDKLPALAQKYPTKNDLQVVLGAPDKGKYTYYKNALATKVRYEETLPAIEWQVTDSIKTICEYECQQAVGTVYGRTWTVWFASELPLNYGPYVLQGLPGLILAAKDSDGLFDFVAVGIENAPADATISVFEGENAQKCTRKRFLEMRSETDGMSQQQMVERILNHDSDGKKKTVYAIQDKDGKDISNEPIPKKNFLDKE